MFIKSSIHASASQFIKSTQKIKSQAITIPPQRGLKMVEESPRPPEQVRTVETAADELYNNDLFLEKTLILCICFSR